MNCILCGRSVTIIQTQTPRGPICAKCMESAEPVPGQPGQYTIKKTLWRSIVVDRPPNELQADSLVRLRAAFADALDRVEEAISDADFTCAACCDTGRVVCVGCVGLPNEQRASCARCAGKGMVACIQATCSELVETEGETGAAKGPQLYSPEASQPAETEATE